MNINADYKCFSHNAFTTIPGYRDGFTFLLLNFYFLLPIFPLLSGRTSGYNSIHHGAGTPL